MTKREKLAPIMGIIALIKDGGKGNLVLLQKQKTQHKNQISFDIELEDC